MLFLVQAFALETQACGSRAVTPVTFKFLCLLVVTHGCIYQVRRSLAVPHAVALPHSCPRFGPELGLGC